MNRLHDRRIFGLLGEVVDGNPTEEMMQSAFQAARLPWKYVSIPVAPNVFLAAFRAIRQLSFAGVHITKPFKILALDAVDRVTAPARKIGAVNCVYVEDGALVGDNTDGRGLVRAVEQSCPPEGASVVVLGAGGAARAVAVELALAGAREIVVVSRSLASGASLVDALRVETGALSRLEPWSQTFSVPSATDLLVNATSVGMSDSLDRPAIDVARLRPGTVVADVVIANRPTALLTEASARGLVPVAGVEMLVKQAAISFERWTGRDADEDVLRRSLEEALFADPGEQASEP